MTIAPPRLQRIVAAQPHPLLLEAEVAFHEFEYQRLRGELQAAENASTLPETPAEATRAALNNLLVRIWLSQARRSSRSMQTMATKKHRRHKKRAFSCDSCAFLWLQK